MTELEDSIENAEILLHTRRRQMWLKVTTVVIVGGLALTLVILAIVLLERSKSNIGVCYDPKLQLSGVSLQAGLQFRAAEGMSDKWQGMCATLKPVFDTDADMYTSAQVRMEPCDPANPAQLFTPSNPMTRPDGKKWYHVSNVELEAAPPSGAMSTSTWELVTPCVEAQLKEDGAACPPGGPCELRFGMPQWYSSSGYLPCSIDDESHTFTFDSAAAQFAFDQRDPKFPCAFFMANVNPNESPRPSKLPTPLSSSPLVQPHGVLGPVVRESDGVVVWGPAKQHSWAWVNPRLSRSDTSGIASGGGDDDDDGDDHCVGLTEKECTALNKVMNS